MSSFCPAFSTCGGCQGDGRLKAGPREIPEGIEIMVIGDTPQVMEIKRNAYLKGPAAGILRETLAKVGLPVDDSKVYYTTAIKCAFPKRRGKQYPNELMRNCHPNIIEEIKAVSPKMVLTLGKTAIQTVYGNIGIKVGEVVGRVTPIPGIDPGIIAVPILHPALIQRSPAEYKPFLTSIELVAMLYKGGKPYETGEVKYQVLRTEELCDKAIQFLSKLPDKIVSADMETTGLDYRIADFLVLGIGFAKNKVLVIPREMAHRVKDFFAIPGLHWIWQHGKYDTKVLWRRALGQVPHEHDVMYMHYAMDETSEHNLEYLSKVFLQAEAYKYKMNQNFKAITLENYEEWFEALCERVAVDCDYTYQLIPVMREKLDEEKPLARLYDDILMPAAPFLSRVEQNGLLVNPKILEDYGEEYKKILEGIMDEIQAMAAPYWDPESYMKEMEAKSAPDKFNPGSPKQMSWMVFKKLKLKPRIKKGTSTGAAILESIEPQHPLVEKVLHYRKVKKEYSTYVLGLLKWRDVDGRVRTNFSLQVTATGRLSSKEPNVQNIPSAFGVGNIRRSFVAPEGYIMMECDYTGAELRWLACLSGCPVLLDIFLTGKNLHDETVIAIWGENFTKQDRMRAKAVNFGIPYGREEDSFMDEFDIPRAEARAMVQGWLNKYYGARDYLMECAQAVIDGKYIETPFGRRRRFGLISEAALHSLQNEARNFPIQSSSSDTTLTAAMMLEEPANKRNVAIVNLVHDSIVFYVPANVEAILEFSKLVNETMTSLPKKLFGYEVPFESDTDIGFTWGDLVALNHHTSTVHWEEKVDGKKVEMSRDFGEWLEEWKEKMKEVYQQDWYQELEPTPPPYQGGGYLPPQLREPQEVS